MPTYYSYDPNNPSLLNTPITGYWENTADWPRSYSYIPAHDAFQGVHPPAPVYQSTQTAQPPANMYYYSQPPAPAPPPVPAGYYANGYYYAAPQAPAPAPAPGWPYSSYTCYPLPALAPAVPAAPAWTTAYSNFFNPSTAAPANYPFQYNCPQAQTAAAAALAANAALAAAPNAPMMFVGTSRAEIDAQIMAMQAAGMMTPAPGMPTQLAPFKPGATQQFWCKELDGSWTLREQQEMLRGELMPGHWEKHATSGYFYWVKHPV